MIRPTVYYTSRTVRRTPTDNPQVLLSYLEDFVRDSTEYLRAHPSAPHPYQSRVRYQLEKPGRERWQGVKRLLRRKRGDCEDLAGYLAAWYRARLGTHAEVALIRITDGADSWYHAVVALPDGTIEDPSRALGM